MTVFDYLDYRLFLKEFYEARKKVNAYFSYRFMGSKVGMDPGYLVKVLQGKYHIAESSIEKFAALCRFSDKESAYFSTLVSFGKAKSQRQVELYFEKLLSLKNVKARRIETDQYEFYRRWYYSAVRALIGFCGFRGNFKALAERLSPPISVREAKGAVHLLERLNFIRKDAKGVYELTDAVITTGREWKSIAVREFQRQTIDLARESLERHAKDIRDISTVTVAVAAADLPEIKERISEFRNAILSLAAENPAPDCVYQLNVQLVPLTEIPGRPE
jgi:uncharacterized protein (TIGR02147 family)